MPKDTLLQNRIRQTVIQFHTNSISWKKNETSSINNKYSIMLIFCGMFSSYSSSKNEKSCIQANNMNEFGSVYVQMRICTERHRLGSTKSANLELAWANYLNLLGFFQERWCILLCGNYEKYPLQSFLRSLPVIPPSGHQLSCNV